MTKWLPWVSPEEGGTGRHLCSTCANHVWGYVAEGANDRIDPQDRLGLLDMNDYLSDVQLELLLLPTPCSRTIGPGSCRPRRTQP